MGRGKGRREVGGVRVGTGHLVAYSSGFVRISPYYKSLLHPVVEDLGSLVGGWSERINDGQLSIVTSLSLQMLWLVSR